MRKTISLCLALGIIFILSVQSTQAQRVPLFLEKKIERLEFLFQKKCQENQSNKRICKITAFRISNIKNQISVFSLREQLRKAKAKQQISLQTSKNTIITITNQERLKKGLPPLRYNAKLETAAQLHVEDMEKKDYFSHTNAKGEQPVDRIKNAGYLIPFDKCNCTKSYTVGENIAVGQTSAQQVMEDWIKSPGHYKNLINPAYDEIGIGISGEYWGQNFGNISLIK